MQDWSRFPVKMVTDKLVRAVLFFVIACAISHGPVRLNGAEPGPGFIAGADMSHLVFFETRGVVYRENGQPGDALAILKSRGLNCIRLRLFTSSDEQAQADPYNCINNLNYTLPLAQRVKEHGLGFMLDFHYSDTWADPQHQIKPAAWTNLDFEGLVAAVRSYTSNTIVAFRQAGAMPDYVQIGNEITAGMIWPDGRVGGTNDTPTQWLKLVRLITNGVQGVRDAAGAQMPKIVIHIDRGADWAGAKWFFDNLNKYKVQFDIIGYSYYPWWHGSLADLQNCVSNTAVRYGKPIMIVETAFPWANSTNIYGIPASTNGQVEYVGVLAETIHGIPGRPVIGVFWWGTEYQQLWGYPLAGFQYRSFWHTNGNVLPVAAAFGQLAAPVRITPVLTNDQLQLSWPISGAGFSLTAAVTPQTGQWSVIGASPVRHGVLYQLTVPLAGYTQRFFRLQQF